MSSAKPSVKIALLGCGTVGTQVARILLEQKEDLAARIGAVPELVAVLVRDVGAPRDVALPPGVLTDDAAKAIAGADVVVETMGGIEPARTLILDAIAAGASVVTANKALLAEQGPSIYEAADAAGVDLYFEAAVAGAIPLVRPVRESLAGDSVRSILGIVNGTTNFILDEMSTKGLAYHAALADAQRLGYAEADPTADVEGYDAAAKAAILSSLAFHMRVRLEDVYREGIAGITPDDVEAAADSGHVLKLLAIAERTDDGVAVRVHPALVPVDHPLAGVHGAFNAVFIEAEAAGELMFYGQGAGGAPTASAVLGDIVSAARHCAMGGRGPRESNYVQLPALPIEATRTRYQVRLDVADQPGVLAKVATVLGDHGVSIDSVRQPPAEEGGGRAQIVIATHEALEGDLAATVAALRNVDVVHQVVSVLRIVGA